MLLLLPPALLRLLLRIADFDVTAVAEEVEATAEDDDCAATKLEEDEADACVSSMVPFGGGEGGGVAVNDVSTSSELLLLLEGKSFVLTSDEDSTPSFATLLLDVLTSSSSLREDLTSLVLLSDESTSPAEATKNVTNNDTTSRTISVLHIMT